MFVYDSLLSVFLAPFGNLIGDIFLILFLMIGIICGVFLRPFFGNQIIKLFPNESRFQEFDIVHETALSVKCKKEKGMPDQRFFKYHPGFIGIRGKFIKKPVTIFLARAGTAFTKRVEQDKMVEVGNLADGVKVCCGDEFFKEIPEAKQQELLDSKIQVTVNLEADPITPEGFSPIREEDIKSEQDQAATQTLWEGKRKEEHGQYINLLLAGGTGAAVVFGLFMLGIIKTPVIIVNNGGNGTAHFILSLIGGLI